jgi:hypothetical protein
VVAAYGDGTIRWHRMDDGRELLALYVLGDKKNWVVWTPEGFYAATPGAYGVLRWHVNRGVDAAAETVPASAIKKLNRPDALPLVLQEMETARALGIADLASARQDVRVATGATNRLLKKKLQMPNFTVTPAKAGIHVHQRLMIPALRFANGRNDELRGCRAFFSILLRGIGHCSGSPPARYNSTSAGTSSGLTPFIARPA